MYYNSKYIIQNKDKEKHFYDLIKINLLYYI